ncbi:unnamed protein product, partial [Ectocarpus sp. 8 AP-2014]
PQVITQNNPCAKKEKSDATTPPGCATAVWTSVTVRRVRAQARSSKTTRAISTDGILSTSRQSTVTEGTGIQRSSFTTVQPVTGKFKPCACPSPPSHHSPPCIPSYTVAAYPLARNQLTNNFPAACIAVPRMCINATPPTHHHHQVSGATPVC